MGGLLIAIAIVVPTLLWADLTNPFVWIAVLSTCAFAAIGFADDYLKVVHRRNLGLTARAKVGLQAATSVLIAVALIIMQTRGLYSTRLLVPFVNPGGIVAVQSAHLLVHPPGPRSGAPLVDLVFVSVPLMIASSAARMDSMGWPSAAR